MTDLADPGVRRSATADCGSLAMILEEHRAELTAYRYRMLASTSRRRTPRRSLLNGHLRRVVEGKAIDS